MELSWYNFMSGYLVWVPVVGYIFGIILKNKEQISKPDYPLAVFFLFLTVSYGLGSNNSFFLLTSVSTFFTLIALLIILLGMCKKLLIPRIIISVLAISSIVTICIVTTSLGNPYRQPQLLWKYQTEGYVRAGDAPLKFNDEIAKFLKTIHDLAKQEGLQPNTPIIDFSAVNPGIIYALDGYTPKTPWIYSPQSVESEEFLFVVLNKFTCEQIAESWLLFTTGAGIFRSHDPRILRIFGANFPNDYTEAGRVPLNFNIKSDKEDVPYLLVYKPKRTHEAATAACIARKRELEIL
jgi:hypothetical protein